MAPMLSICIPHYNFVNPGLFKRLHLQCKSAKINFEILIVDDASFIPNKTYLNTFNQPEFNIIFLDKNIGRAATRNLLASKAHYPYLLFLDADSGIIADDFITKYLENLDDSIVSGGRIYPTEKPTPHYLLHYKYGSKVEQYADSKFQSNNFVLPKSTFSILNFDESIDGYGYEDVVFGLEAKRLGIPLKKIDNPVKHIQLKTNEEFVNDMEQALRNLTELIRAKQTWRLEEDVSISAFYQKLKRYKLRFLLSIGQQKILKKLKNLLLLNTPVGTTTLIAVYKLYYYHALQKN